MRAAKLTPEMIGALCDARRKGASAKDAAASVNVPAYYISRWKRMAKSSSNPLISGFSRLWEQAEAECEQSVSAALMQAYQVSR